MKHFLKTFEQPTYKSLYPDLFRGPKKKIVIMVENNILTISIIRYIYLKHVNKENIIVLVKKYLVKKMS